MNENRIYFNQNVIYYKDKNYNSGGSLEISICNNTDDYKTFSAPTLHISVIGENNLRRLSALNYIDTVDLYNSIKYIIQNIESIYSTNRNNVLIKKYHFDRVLKFEFIQIQGIDERVVAISIIYNSSDFTKVVIPYTAFTAFAIGILKYFVNEYVDISFAMSTRNLLTEVLEQNKLIRNGISILPSSISENQSQIKGVVGTLIAAQEVEETNSSEITEVIEDFDKFLGKDMENIIVEDLTSKAVLVEKPSNNTEVTSLFITKTLTNDMSVLESMISAAVTRPDPMISLFEGFRRSMNLTDEFTFLPSVTKQDLKSFLYISKITHDVFLNSYLNQNKAIPSGFPALKYNIEDTNKIDSINIQISYDLLLIAGFMKIFRSRMESRESNIIKNGSLFYLRLRTFLDPLVYSFLDPTKGKIINTIISSNFEKYSGFGFFDYYQKILIENKFETITINDIKSFGDELNDKILTKDVLSVNINDRHDNFFKSGFLRINSDNKLSIEQIINELVPLEVLEKNGVELKEGSTELKDAVNNFSISEEILNVFLKKVIKEEKVIVTNILKTVKFFNNEIPETYRENFFEFIDKLQYTNFDFINSPYEVEELGDNVIKALYVWNETDNKKEPLTTYRGKLEDCLLTKDLILTKYKNETIINNTEWDLGILDE